jgi:hypothetical protein
MGLFDASQIMNLVGQLGGDHQEAGQLLSSVLGQGGAVDTDQHGGLLQQLGIDPQQLAQGGYQHHLDNQNAPDFQQQGADDDQSQGGYDQQQGGGYDQQQGSDEGQGGGYDQRGGYDQGQGSDEGQDGGYDQDQSDDQQGADDGQGGY